MCTSFGSILSHRPAPLTLLLLCTLSLLACNVAPQKRTADSRVQNPQNISANSEQIRLRMRGLVQPMTGTIVAAADQVIAGTTDPAIRREALLWKIDAVPALREALFQPNPITGVGDAWALTFQLIDYFDKGPGAKNLGPSRTIALQNAQALEAEMARVAASLIASGNASHARDYIRKWASEHPIQHSIAGRESVLSHVATSELAETFSAREAMGNLVVTMDDLQRRLEIYAAQLPDQARWHAELFAMDFARQYQFDRAIPLAEHAVKSADLAVETLERTLPGLERLTVVEKTPALLSAEREVAIKALASEMAKATIFAQAERVEALKQVAVERLAAQKDAEEILRRQRIAFAADVEGLATRTVDHALARVAQWGVMLLGAVFLCLVAVLLLRHRTPRARTAVPVLRAADAPVLPAPQSLNVIASSVAWPLNTGLRPSSILRGKAEPANGVPAPVR